MRSLLLAFVSGLLACSSTTSSPPSTSDAAMDGVSADDTSSAGDTTTATDVATTSDAPAMEDVPTGSCNALKNDGTTVTSVYTSEQWPAPKGGTIVEGVYVRSKFVIYGEPTGPGQTDKTVAWFHDGTIDFVQSLDDGPDTRFTATYSTSGTALTLTRTCPETTPSPYTAYDATPTTIVFYDPTNKRALHYARR